MNDLAKEALIEALKGVTMQGLDMLIAHNIKGAELIKAGIADVVKLQDHNNTLLDILTFLKPLFGIVESWLEKTFPTLFRLFNWAKTMWNSLFGAPTTATA
jgi:hypothetical protein